MLKFITSLFVIALLVALPARADDAFKVSWVEGKDYVSLRELARVYTCAAQGPQGRSINLFNKWNKLAFTTNGREVMINDVLVWMHEPLQLVNKRWMIRAVDARKVIDPILRPSENLKSVGHRIVVLDPGHGGQDTGAKGRRGVEEKRVVLDVARRVRTQLQQAGVKVYMTRESDRFIELDDRCKKTRSWGGDVFVSIHLNSAPSALPGGTETYTIASAGYASTAGGSSSAALNGNKYEGANSALGYYVHKSLTQRINEGDRGVKRSRFLVLKNAPCPAILVECLFVSNRSEEEKLLNDAFRESMAQGISRGILNYLNAVKRAKLSEP